MSDGTIDRASGLQRATEQRCKVTGDVIGVECEVGGFSAHTHCPVGGSDTPADQPERLQAKMLMAMVDSKRVWAVSSEGNPDCTLPVLISVSVAAEVCAAVLADQGEKP